jgi:uncharacterized membrane protein (DUF2068 family)
MAQRRDRGLVLIGVFKLLKSGLLLGAGVLLLMKLHGAAPDTIAGWARHLRIDPDNRLVHGLLERVFRLDRRKLAALDLGTFIYAAVFATEGIGLLLAKRWAEYVTVGVTISFVPLEMFELFRRVNAVRAGTVALNIAVVIYLVRRLARRAREHRAGA